MNAPTLLRRLLWRPVVVLADDAAGIELERRGYARGEPTARALDTQPKRGALRQLSITADGCDKLGFRA